MTKRHRRRINPTVWMPPPNPDQFWSTLTSLVELARSITVYHALALMTGLILLLLFLWSLL